MDVILICFIKNDFLIYYIIDIINP